jgi:CO/xanthine dehydrogenase FAD-binding subunit
MITSDFEYFRPSRPDEAFSLMRKLTQGGKRGIYYSGGTEVVTRLQKGNLAIDAVIDLKGIAEMDSLEISDDYCVIGSNVVLNDVIDIEALAMCKDVLKNIADHTIRNAITFGGNLMGSLAYREALLPLLAFDGKVVVVMHDIGSDMGSNIAYEEWAIRELFDKRVKLPKDAFIYQIIMPRVKNQKFYYARYTASQDVDYPLLTVYAVINSDEIVLCLSGYAPYPMWHRFSKAALMLSVHPVLDVMSLVESFAQTDQRASASYRRSLLQCDVTKMLEVWLNV